jgi:hypothetical protein
VVALACQPSATFDAVDRPNILLVTMRAEIKLCCYFEMVQLRHPTTLSFRYQILCVVPWNLSIYFTAASAEEGVRGADKLAKRLADGRNKEPCVAKPDSAKSIERECDEESKILGAASRCRSRLRRRRPRDADPIIVR